MFLKCNDPNLLKIISPVREKNKKEIKKLAKKNSNYKERLNQNLSEIYFENLNPESIKKSWFVRNYNFLYLMRVYLLSILIFSLQYLQAVQVTASLVLMLVSSAMTIYYQLTVGIFNSTYISVFKIIQEVSMTCMVGMINAFCLDSFNDFLGADTRILLVLSFSVLLVVNILIEIVSVILSISLVFKGKSKRKTVKEVSESARRIVNEGKLKEKAQMKDFKCSFLRKNRKDRMSRSQRRKEAAYLKLRAKKNNPQRTHRGSRFGEFMFSSSRNSPRSELDSSVLSQNPLSVSTFKKSKLKKKYMFNTKLTSSNRIQKSKLRSKRHRLNKLDLDKSGIQESSSNRDSLFFGDLETPQLRMTNPKASSVIKQGISRRQARKMKRDQQFIF